MTNDSTNGPKHEFRKQLFSKSPNDFQTCSNNKYKTIKSIRDVKIHFTDSNYKKKLYGGLLYGLLILVQGTTEY